MEQKDVIRKQNEIEHNIFGDMGYDVDSISIILRILHRLYI